MRQAKQNVSVQAGHTARADHAHHVTGQLEPLLAPDGLLDFGVKILHPDRGAVHTRRCQGIQSGLIHLIWINLDREFRALGQGGHI